MAKEKMRVAVMHLLPMQSMVKMIRVMQILTGLVRSGNLQG